jgi:hypothetical protein
VAGLSRASLHALLTARRDFCTQWSRVYRPPQVLSSKKAKFFQCDQDRPSTRLFSTSAEQRKCWPLLQSGSTPMRLRKPEQPSQSWVPRRAPEKNLPTRRKNLLVPLNSIHILGCGGFELLFRSDGLRTPLISTRGGRPW